MARSLRFQYSGEVHHVMARADGSKTLPVPKTTVSRERLGNRLGTGHPGSVSRMLGEVKRNPKLGERFNELERF